MILSLPIGISVSEASKAVREALSPEAQGLFDLRIARDRGSFIYLRTVAKSLDVILMPVKARSIH